MLWMIDTQLLLNRPLRFVMLQQARRYQSEASKQRNPYMLRRDHTAVDTREKYSSRLAFPALHE
jgi:hypothetical protein